MNTQFLLKILFIYLLERAREGEREKHQCVVASRVSPTGDLACALDFELNQQPFALLAGTQPLSHTSQG